MKDRLSIRMSLLIGLSFFWSGSLFLTWMYHLNDLAVPSIYVDIHTDIIGYFCQAIGCLILAHLIQKRRIKNERFFFLFINSIDFVLGVISYTTNNQLIALIFGYLMNFVHGFIAGIYLWYLAKYVETKKRALTFGAGYALGTIGSYLISIILPNNFLNSIHVFLLYGLTIVLIYLLDNKHKKITDNFSLIKYDNKLLILLIVFIVTINTVKNGSFYFPMQDINLGTSLELSRCAYAVGLLIAGVINDSNRKHGLILCLVSLIFPFVMLTLEQLIEAKTIVWILNYFFNGFFNVYRIILFSDLSNSRENYYISGFGLTFGRIGDSLGALLGILFGSKEIFYIILMVILYLLSIVLIINIYSSLYNNTVSSDEQLFHNYAFSLREKDVCKLILQNKSNKEIGATLFISNNTVKTHIKSILKKTGCQNKLDLINLFNKKGYGN